MAKPDLGDRYNNPLKYLTAPNLETISDFESPIVTENSDPDANSVNAELISMLDTLAQIINLENRHRNNSEVFIPPSNFKDSDVSAKISFIHSLTESLNLYLTTGKFSYTQFSSFYNQNEEELLENPKPRVKKDAVSKLINCNEGVYLNPKEIKQLAAILIGSCRDSAKNSIKELANVSKSKLEKKKNEFREVSDEIDSLNIEQEKMINENTNLRKE